MIVVEPYVYFCVFFFGIMLRAFGAFRFSHKYLQLYPHFNTPLVDPRELHETFDTYDRTGKFFARPLQIGQSEMYLHCLYMLNAILADQGIDGVMLACGIFEALSLFVQLILFHLAYTATEKKSVYMVGALFWLTVNPI